MPSISIGQHLINRLKEINIDVIFGVPGDFNMVRVPFFFAYYQTFHSFYFYQFF
jgi:TPP-dependent 2-oxoacid decarboxylase